MASLDLIRLGAVHRFILLLVPGGFCACSNHGGRSYHNVILLDKNRSKSFTSGMHGTQGNKADIRRPHFRKPFFFFAFMQLFGTPKI